ncbi:MAG: protein kinase family protein [Streptosporangiaceae bacterium]
MSTYTAEPGFRLAGRYRLVDQTSAGTGWTYWKATDETLARPVTVLTFAPDFPRTTEAVAAARAASRLNEPRFSQVFDVEDTEEAAYVVTEWVTGESLIGMLSDGPLDSPRAVSLMAEAAQALAGAHAAGLSHLRLSPSCLHWTRGSGVKITGLGIDVALTGPDAATAEDGDSPDLTDTRDLARLLYAALTGYWPRPAVGADGTDGPAEAGPGMLPPAPLADGQACTPRQVSAAVPANIDALTCRALFQRAGRHGPALSTTRELADALASVAQPDPLPVVLPTITANHPAVSGYEQNGSTNPYPQAGPPARTRPARTRPARSRNAPPRQRPPAKRSPAATAVIGAVIVLVLAAIGVGGWALSHQGNGSATAQPTTGASSSSAPSAAASHILKPVSANSFDVLGDDNGDEDGSAAKYVLGNNPGQFWHTDYYDNYPRFGNLKKGTGLILDMGEQVQLSQVAVQFGTSCCAHVEIEIGNDNNPSPSTLASFTPVRSDNHVSGNTTFNVTSKTTGRYVLIWITYLPPLVGAAGEYQAQIYNVVVHGSAVSQSG